MANVELNFSLNERVELSLNQDRFRFQKKWSKNGLALKIIVQGEKYLLILSVDCVSH